MKQKTQKTMIRRIVHRVMTVVLAAVVLVLSFPLSPAETSADGDQTVTFKKTTLWRWKRVTTNEEAHDVDNATYCIIFWGGDDRGDLFAYGSYLDDDNDHPGTPTSSGTPGMNGEAYGFYTKTSELVPGSGHSSWCARYHKDYKEQPRYVFYINDWDLNALHAGTWCTTEFTKCYWTNDDEISDYSHCVTTSDKSGSTYSGCVRIWRHDGTPIVGSDEHLGITGSGKYISLYESSIDDSRQNFHLFFGEEVKFTLLPDVTVPTGTTLKLSDNMILDEGCTITVEPGAVLTIEGEFLNNGFIYNYGTVVVKENARVYSAMLTDDRPYGTGSIFCMGERDGIVNDTRDGEGNLIILENAQVILPNTGAQLAIGKGASCINNGVLVLPNGMIISNGRFHNSSTGFTYISATAQENMYNDLDIQTCRKLNAPPILVPYAIIGTNLGMEKTECLYGIEGYGKTTTVVNDGIIYCNPTIIALPGRIKNNGSIIGNEIEYIEY